MRDPLCVRLQASAGSSLLDEAQRMVSELRAAGAKHAPAAPLPDVSIRQYRTAAVAAPRRIADRDR